MEVIQEMNMMKPGSWGTQHYLIVPLAAKQHMTAEIHCLPDADLLITLYPLRQIISPLSCSYYSKRKLIQRRRARAMVPAQLIDQFLITRRCLRHHDLPNLH